MSKEIFCGELYGNRTMTECYLGNIYKVEGGYIIRKPIPYKGNRGPVQFDGRKFIGKDFSLIKKVRYSSTQILAHYTFSEGVQ